MKERHMTDKVKRIILENAFLYLLALALALRVYDVEEIGPHSSSIGLSTVNAWFRRICHYSDTVAYSGSWYGIVRVLFFVSVAVCLFWTVLFIRDWVKCGGFDGVGTDKNLAASFFLYVLSVIICVFYRILPINYSPVILEGTTKLAPSFPAPFVLWIILAMCTTTFHAWDIFGEKKKIAILVSVVCTIVIIFGIIAGLTCGVYWLTDILGAILWGVTLIMLYSFFFFV